MDNWRAIIYPMYMLSGIRIYSADPVWRQILTDLNAVVADAPGPADLDFDALGLDMPIGALELKAAILNAGDNTSIIRNVFGRDVSLSRLHSNIVAVLYKSGGLNIADLKSALGYSPDAATHTVDTAIYQLRKIYGRDFIQNKNGVYHIGKL